MDDDEILLDGRKPCGEENEVQHEHEHENEQAQEQSPPDEKETSVQASGGEEDHVAHVVAAIDAYLADPQHEDEQTAWSDDAVVQDTVPAEDAAVQDTDPVDHAEEVHENAPHTAPCAAYVEEEGESGGDEEEKEEEVVDAVADADEHDDDRKSQPGDRSPSRRSSSSSCASAASGRRASLRTEALIQAAARAVVATIEQQEGAHVDHFSFLPGGLAGEPATVHDDDENHNIAGDEKETKHDEGKEEVEKEQEKEHGAMEGELDELDHPDTDDVFSDHGGSRSSFGSFEQRSADSRSSRSCSSSSSSVHNSPAEEQGKQKPSSEGGDHAGGVWAEDLEMDEGSQTGSVRRHPPRLSGMSGVSGFSRGTTPRISDVSGISSLSQYERRKRQDVDSNAYHGDDNNNDENDDANSMDDGFTPYMARGTPRPAFRTPSDVRAIQMSSPSPSVIFGVSPRSAARRRRQQDSNGDEEERPTPTRFKVIRRPEPAPLVLLHATLMPTRWVWSDVLRSLDERMCADGPTSEDGTASKGGFPFPEPSAALRRLHTAWCQIQEYALGGDTVAERGLLLPHPQNDYEVLEERLLEALELPVRRRARILECGHYLGPAVADDDDEEDEYEDEYDEDDAYATGGSGRKDQRHWCTTCRSDIRYESLGAERVFRVKVYASNGLVTVGAWEACWREMERVDVEIEPIVADAALLRELNQLRSLQQEALLWRQAREAEEEAEAAEAAAAVDKTPLPHDDDYTTSPTLEREPITAAEDLGRPVDFPDDPPLPSARAMSPPAGLDASLEVERVLEEERKRREAEERLREIYGRTPPQTTAPISPVAEEASFVEDVHDDADTMGATRETPSTFGPSPPSPSAEAYARRQARRQRQGSGFSAVHEEATPGQPVAPRSWAEQQQQQQQQQQQPTPYEAASLPELLLAAAKVFLRDSQHVVIAVLSALVILLVVTRSPAQAPLPLAGAVDTVVPPVKAVAHGVPAAAADAIVPVVSLDTLVEVQTETVVEKQTVRIVQTVTETATATTTTTATTTVVAADERDEWSPATAPTVSEVPRASEAFETSGLSETPLLSPSTSVVDTKTLEERTLRPEPTSAVVSLFDAVALPMSAVDADAAAIAHDEL